MSRAENIERLIKSLLDVTSAELDERTLKDVLLAIDKSKKPSAASQPNFWRIIMKSKITKFAVAAVISIAVLLGVKFVGGPDMSSIAWAEVISQFNNVPYMHFYKVTSKENDFPSIEEGWYAHGKSRSRSCSEFDSYGAYQTFDDGQRWLVYDRHNNITCVGKSYLAEYQNFLELIAEGVFQIDILNFKNKVPSMVRRDFLIYDFDPPKDMDWIQKISVTVGRDSLLPIQIKTYYKTDKWYSDSDLLIFDYEDSEKPLEFFELPTETKAPHGIGQVILGGEPVEIELHNAPGIKKAIVRLHTKFDGPVEDLLVPYRERYELVGGPVYFMEITFILNEGYRSNTAESCPLWLNQGVKAALGKEDTWPDGKYRNIRYTPVLRATDKENVFMLELSCWLRTKEAINP